MSVAETGRSSRFSDSLYILHLEAQQITEHRKMSKTDKVLIVHDMFKYSVLHIFVVFEVLFNVLFDLF